MNNGAIDNSVGGFVLTTFACLENKLEQWVDLLTSNTTLTDKGACFEDKDQIDRDSLQR